MDSTNNCCAHKSTTAAGPGPAYEVIAMLAELLWEQAGRPEGRDTEFWLQAEAVLMETNEPIRCRPKP